MTMKGVFLNIGFIFFTCKELKIFSVINEVKITISFLLPLHIKINVDLT